jgi:two-component system, sensor histidine kinase RegB
MTPSQPRGSRLTASTEWLISARWANLVAQAAATIIGYALLGHGAPLPVASAIIAVGIATNIAARRWLRRRPAPSSVLVMLLIATDALLLTLLLSMSGGAMNPLSIMYLVYITLAAVVLNPRWAWITMVLCIACFGVLFLVPADGALMIGNDLSRHLEAMRVHVQSMWWSFVLAAIITAYFGARLSHALDRQAVELAAARHEAERNQRLAALTTLAAGAAHELSTPLATIAIAAEELERTLSGPSVSADVRDDLLLIRRELVRCRQTLNRMAADAGATVGEVVSEVSAAAVARMAIDALIAGDAPRISLRGDLDVQLVAPPAALSQALANLLRNAVEADATGGQVHLAVERRDGGTAFVVTDRGSGIEPAALDRVGEPFFTTKPPGRGMGLGVFLTRALIEQLGGHLQLDSSNGGGTTAVIFLPGSGVPS